MDEQRKDEQMETSESGYTPRPAWQVWAARIGLVVFVTFLVVFYIRAAGGRL